MFGARATYVIGAAWLAGGCGHRSADDVSRGHRASSPPAGAAVFGELVRSLPTCADEQPSVTVEDALKREWTAGECRVIEGELVLDSAPAVCRSHGLGATDSCLASWFLLGTPPKAAPEPRLPGVRRYRPDAHSMMLSNHEGFLYAVQCTHDFLAYCDEDDAGRARLPAGAKFHLPEAFREEGGPTHVADVSRARVAILGAVHERKGAFDMSRICRIDQR